MMQGAAAWQDYTVLETVGTYSPLGIRFWDPAVDAQINGALHVTAKHADRPERKYNAHRSRSGIYFFDGLYGFRHYDTYAETDSPGPSHRYIVEVDDPAGLYIGAGFSVDLPLPYKGLFLSGASGSPGHPPPRGFNLYSSVSRPLPSGFTVLRAELHDHINDRPAAHAVTRVDTQDGYSWYGLADEQGRVAVVMPYPVLTDGIVYSPGSSGGVRLYEQTWPLDVAVFYEPANLVQLPDSRLFDYVSVLSQGGATVFEIDPDDGGSPQSQLQIDLEFGRETVLRSTGLSQLVVSPAGSPI